MMCEMIRTCVEGMPGMFTKETNVNLAQHIERNSRREKETGRVNTLQEGMKKGMEGAS